MTVDADYYINVFKGTEQADIDRLLTRAKIAVDVLILREPEGRIQEKAYKDAVCAQAEYVGMNGGVESWLMSVSGSAQSFSVGAFSMSGGASSAGSGGSNKNGICSDALSILEISGLLERRCVIW